MVGLDLLLLHVLLVVIKEFKGLKPKVAVKQEPQEHQLVSLLNFYLKDLRKHVYEIQY